VPEFEDNANETRKASLPVSEIELKVITPQRYSRNRRRSSNHVDKIIIKSQDEVKVLPGVLTTYNEKYLTFHQQPAPIKRETFRETSPTFKAFELY